MNHISVRVTLTNVKFRDVRETLCQNAESYGYVIEHTLEQGRITNPHVHFYLYTKNNLACLRGRLRKLKLTKTEFAFKTLKLLGTDTSFPVASLAYLMKGNLSPDYKEEEFQSGLYYNQPYFHNIPESQLDLAKAYDQSVKQSMLEKKHRLPVWKQIIQERNLTCDTDFHLICQAVVEYYRDKELLVRMFSLKSTCDTIYLHLRPDDATQHFIGQIMLMDREPRR